MGAAPKLDVNFIKPFIDGVVHTAKVSCSTDIVVNKAMLKGDVNHKKYDVTTDIAAIIGVSSEYYKGSIALCFPEKVFLDLISKMLGETFTEITSDMEDGAGELLNMIFGFAKKILNENGHSFEKALPTIVRAPGLMVNHTGTKVSLILPFVAPVGHFFIEINIELK